MEETAQAEGISYFKTSEWKSMTKEFQRYKALPEPYGRNGANQVRKRLEKILLESTNIYGVGVVVPVEDHHEVMKHQEEMPFSAIKSTLKLSRQRC